MSFAKTMPRVSVWDGFYTLGDDIRRLGSKSPHLARPVATVKRTVYLLDQATTISLCLSPFQITPSQVWAGPLSDHDHLMGSPASKSRLFRPLIRQRLQIWRNNEYHDFACVASEINQSCIDWLISLYLVHRDALVLTDVRSTSITGFLTHDTLVTLPLAQRSNVRQSGTLFTMVGTKWRQEMQGTEPNRMTIGWMVSSRFGWMFRSKPSHFISKPSN